MAPRVQTGLDHFIAEKIGELKTASLGVCCHPASVNQQIRGLPQLLRERGISVKRWFAPEHGLLGQLQDMEEVFPDSPQVVSLYGDSADSLRPTPEAVAGLDVILFDLRDIGTRYYTFAATLRYLLEAVAGTGTRVIVLDRPNPIGGMQVEGGVVQAGFESFVGALPIAVRHGMTMGELARFMTSHLNIDADLEVIPCTGWNRSQIQGDIDLPWVLPSPNMPTPETALIYPGMCLVEGTTLSEGRGTTLPFHLVGAPGLDGHRFAEVASQLAREMELSGVTFRPTAFVPHIQKHRGESCQGIQVHVTNADRLHSLMLGMVVITAAALTSGDVFQWRTEEYEFVKDPLAIDLLWGAAGFRKTVDSLCNSTTDPASALLDLLNSRETERQMFLEQRESCLLYR
ncbi:MAG: exo-beta-N-acetylmuramidase NamZ family protein [Planctomycetota bacterium]